MVGGVVSNWDVKDFQPMSTNLFLCLVMKPFVMLVTNDQYYAYQICWSIIHGALDRDAQLLEVGPLCHSRWMMLDCRLLRYHISQDKPNLTLGIFSKLF